MAAKLRQLSEHLYVFDDTCNVYLVKDGEAGLLIDAGSGTVADLVGDAVCARWSGCCTPTITATSAGARRGSLPSTGHGSPFQSTSGTCSTHAREHWQTKRIFDNYNDRNTFFAPGEDIPVDAVLEDYEEFRWRGLSFFVLPAKGHTFGSSALLADIDGQLVAFTGDLLAPVATSTSSTRWSTATATWPACCSRSSRLQALRAASPT